MAGEEGRLNLLATRSFRVFAGPGFAGNPTTLVELAGPCGDAELLAHSRGLPSVDNLYHWAAPEPGHHCLRVFSHHGEVLVCGHALLAAAHYLLPANGEQVMLETPAFRHMGRRHKNRIWVSLPAWHGEEHSQPLLEELLLQAGVAAPRIRRFPNRVWLALCESAGAVGAFSRERFPWHALDPLSPGALILSAALPQGGYALRYFSPWHGKQEDTATGSAQCYLAPYWLAEGESARVLQLSPAGQAEMQVRLAGGDVWLGGEAT